MEVWKKTLDRLAADLSHQNFTKWIKPLHAREGESGVVYLAAPDRFSKEWVEERFLGEITEAIARVSDGRLRVELGIDQDSQGRRAPAQERAELGPTARRTTPAEELAHARFHPRFTGNVRKNN